MSAPAIANPVGVVGPDPVNLDRFDWDRLSAALHERGFAAMGPLLKSSACRSLQDMYDDDALFRSHIHMARHGFGRGEYKYFAGPLPGLIADLRRAFYERLAPVANQWLEMLGREDRFPADHAAYLARCHRAGQRHPTPLLLRYGPEDYNCLHQDLYGDHVFPFQVAILLNTPDKDFTGGEFILTEQRPRMQSRAEVVPLGLGHAVIFAVNERPATGKRGVYRTRMRHGVSRVLSGRRHVLGLIFHDAV